MGWACSTGEESDRKCGWIEESRVDARTLMGLEMLYWSLQIIKTTGFRWRWNAIGEFQQ